MEFDRGVAALLGLAIGDAMGAPLEGLPPSTIIVKDMAGGGAHNLPPGSVTDDTIQACTIACSLIVCGGYNPEDVILRLVENYRSNPDFYGPTSSKVFKLIMSGYPPLKAAKRASDHNMVCSNGSVMRGAPMGIFFPPDEVWAPSTALSLITHYDKSAAECSSFVNRMISGMCRNEKMDMAYENALMQCREKDVISNLGIIREGTIVPVPSLDAITATHCALSVLFSCESFEECILQAVNMGGDADTIGAITGALAGARWGRTDMPERWINSLRVLGTLIDVAEKLCVAAKP